MLISPRKIIKPPKKIIKTLEHKIIKPPKSKLKFSKKCPKPWK